MKFAIFFLGVYINILAVSSVTVTFFLGGWLGPWDLPVIWFVLKVFLLVFFFMWVRATMARFRYDQLMDLGWKFLLPLSFFHLIAVAAFVAAK